MLTKPSFMTPPCGQLEDLGVNEHGLVEHLAVFEGPPHDLGGVDRRAVVGERDRAALDEPAELGQFLPLAVLGHRADREDVAVARRAAPAG